MLLFTAYLLICSKGKQCNHQALSLDMQQSNTFRVDILLNSFFNVNNLPTVFI